MEPKDEKKPYGDVKYADPEDGKYPIDTEEHIRAAWSYVNMPKNAAVLGDKAAKVKAAVVAAWKDKIDPAGPPSAHSEEPEFVQNFSTDLATFCEEHGLGYVMDFAGREPVRGMDGTTPWLEKPAVLFHTGKHKGKTYTEADMKAIANGFRPPVDGRWTVPMQLDHSESARDTIGWPVKMWAQGKRVLGTLRFVGEEAVKNAESGIWRLISMGLRLNPEGKVLGPREVTITAFPYLGAAQTFDDKGGNPMEPEDLKKKDGETDEEFAARKKKAAAQDAKTDAGKMQDVADKKNYSDVEATIAKMTEEFDARTKALEAKFAAQEKVLRFKEATETVVTFMEGGKTLPPMKDAELALIQTFSDDQMALYRSLKEKQPAFVEFGVRGSVSHTKPGEGTDPAKTAERVEQFMGAMSPDAQARFGAAKK